MKVSASSMWGLGPPYLLPADLLALVQCSGDSNAGAAHLSTMPEATEPVWLKGPSLLPLQSTVSNRPQTGYYKCTVLSGELPSCQGRRLQFCTRHKPWCLLRMVLQGFGHSTELQGLPMCQTGQDTDRASDVYNPRMKVFSGPSKAQLVVVDCTGRQCHFQLRTSWRGL